MHDLSQGVAVAVRAFGTQTALATALGIERSAISQWKQVPAKRVLAIEEMSEGRASRHAMRPDVFGPLPKRKGRAT